MKGAGMLFVSLRGVNFGFWSHLGCTGQNAIIFSREGHAKKYKNIYLICIFLIHFIYSIHIIQVFSFVCVLTWSLLGVKKSLGHAQIGLLQGFNSKFPTSIPTPFICEVPPGHSWNGLTLSIFSLFLSPLKKNFFSLFYTSQILFTLQKQQINRRLKEFPVL